MPGFARLLALAGLGASGLLIACAPLWMPEGYDWRFHTISDSAAQEVPLAVFARIGLALLGFAAVLVAARPNIPNVWGRVCLGLYGLAIVGSAFWSQTNWMPGGVPSDSEEARLHSLFAQAAGLFYTCAASLDALSALNAGERIPRLSLLAVASALIVPLLMFGANMPGGASQRIMFAIAYAWIASLALRSGSP